MNRAAAILRDDMTPQLREAIQAQIDITEEIREVRESIKRLPFWAFMRREKLERKIDRLVHASNAAYHHSMYIARAYPSRTL